jgi:HrpA-like RNA helicase
MMAIKVLVASYFTTNLPIVSHLEEFAICIEKYDNIIVKTGTGSGKSTMLPPYLIAMGYGRVVVTQPRRLPCVMICKRIKKTHSADLVGYSYAGTQ